MFCCKFKTNSEAKRLLKVSEIKSVIKLKIIATVDYSSCITASIF